MRKIKTQKGITLIALIITIIVLLILAVVAIGAVQNDGIINYAKNARDEYGKKSEEENKTLQGYLDKLNKNSESLNSGSGSNLVPTMTVAQAQQKNDKLNESSNTVVEDSYGNIIVVPAGFKITSDANNVTEGIVIEDCTEVETAGKQFVWVPVGNVYYSEAEYKTITLGRYSNFNLNDQGQYTPAQTAENYATAVAINGCTEDTEENHNADYTNAIAKDIGTFANSAVTNRGYYIARNSENDFKLQQEVSNLSRNMYTSNNFTSDLVNSYAWDTAIIFIQTFGGRENYAYEGLNSGDEFCNIIGMSRRIGTYNRNII